MISYRNQVLCQISLVHKAGLVELVVGNLDRDCNTHHQGGGVKLLQIERQAAPRFAQVQERQQLGQHFQWSGAY